MRLNCQKCGGPIPRQQGPGGVRKFCPTCSPKRIRKPRVEAATPRPVAPAGRVTSDRPNVTAATQREMEAAGVPLDGVDGLLLLLLARRIDSGDETAAGLVALVKVHAEILAEALAQAQPPEENPLDVIRRLRAVREAGERDV